MRRDVPEVGAALVADKIVATPKSVRFGARVTGGETPTSPADWARL